MSATGPVVGILMGSASDWETMKHAHETLAQFGVAHEDVLGVPMTVYKNRARSLRDQCAAAGVAFNLKQWGEWLPVDADGDWPITACDGTGRTFPGTTTCMTSEGHDFARVGKKAAGRLLDVVLHDAYPASHVTECGGAA